MIFVIKEMAKVKIWTTERALYTDVEFARESLGPNRMLSAALKQMVAQADAEAEQHILSGSRAKSTLMRFQATYLRLGIRKLLKWPEALGIRAC